MKMKMYKLYIGEVECAFDNLEDAQLAQNLFSKSVEIENIKYQGIYKDFKGESPSCSLIISPYDSDRTFDDEQSAISYIEAMNIEKAKNFQYKITVDHINIYDDFTIKVTEAKKLRNFCKKYDLKEFFICKDHGAYIGATKRYDDSDAFEKSIHYINGGDPLQNDNWCEHLHRRFGDDDFVHKLPIEWLDISIGQYQDLQIKIIGNVIGLDGIKVFNNER